VLAELAADKKTLRMMVDRVRETPTLMAMCERHRLLDKFVVHEAPNGMRLRIHISTHEHRDRPHDHRFSFTSRILTGGYRHTRHELVGDFDPNIPWHVQDDTDAVLTNVKAVPRFVTQQTANSTYTLHHTEVHTTFTTPDTVSLFLRGPAEKDRSLITERATGRLWWRYGAGQERLDRRARKQMQPAEFEELVERLRGLEVI
jgi:glycogen debranching enzyme